MPDSNALVNIKEHLNKTGVFLEQKVQTSLERHPVFTSIREHPYSTLNLINNTIPEIIEGAIDVFSLAKVSESTVLFLCIECKKADPKQKHWVFELRKTGDEKYPFVYFDGRANNINYDMNIFFPNLGYGGMKFFDKGIQVFQFKDTTGELSRETQEMVYYATKSCNKAVKAYASAPSNLFRAFELPSEINALFLPIVVTTANLWVSGYNPQDISWRTGEIEEDKLILESKDWVHFEFPLPVNLKLKDKDSVEYEKRPTFIVNAEKFPDFIDNMLKDMPRYILDW